MLSVKVCIVAAYFGQLPSHFALWLDSCERNPEFDWLFLHDREHLPFRMPANVHDRRTNLNSIKQVLQAGTGDQISLESPYKLCDYRPVFFLLLEHFACKSEYWGHCDLDMIFGNLSKFVTSEHLAKYDKIFDHGHLTLYRNSVIARSAYKLSSSKISWTQARTAQKTLGFDEKSGINEIWKNNKLHSLMAGDAIADISPMFKGMLFDNLKLNRPCQHFFYVNGRIIQAYKLLTTKWQLREFAYIHFQKRPIPYAIDALPKSPAVLIASDGFAEIQEWPPTSGELAERPSNFPTGFNENSWLLKLAIKRAKSSLLG